MDGNQALVVTILSGETRVYGVALVGNTISGGLTCSGNTPGVTDFDASNSVRGGASGQCAGL